MLKLTKKADYGLIALRHLASIPGATASTKDIAEAYVLAADTVVSSGRNIFGKPKKHWQRCKSCPAARIASTRAFA